MTDRNWDAELAKIDRQLASLSDEELRRPAPRGGALPAPVAPASAAAGASAGASAAAPARAAGGGGAAAPWQGWARTAVAVAGAVGLWYWPWPGSCGAPVLGMVAASGAVSLLGVWGAVGTWRHRQPVLHVLSLLAALWGGVLAARDVLPRTGYAIPTAAHPATWQCDAPAPSGAPAPGPLAAVRTLLFGA